MTRKLSPNPEDRMSPMDEIISTYRERILYRSAMLHGIVNAYECGSMKKLKKYMEWFREDSADLDAVDHATIDRIVKQCGDRP